jgi:hypothetical protein
MLSGVDAQFANKGRAQKTAIALRLSIINIHSLSVIIKALLDLANSDCN